jgi:hypothetical protein
MPKIKKFKQFLNEGKYDRLVGILVDDILQIIKESRDYWDGEDKEDYETHHVHEYEGTLKKVNLFLNIGRNRDLNFKDNFEIVANAYTLEEDEKNSYKKDLEEESVEIEDDGSIVITIIINPDKEPEIYRKIIPELHDAVRHEIEHLTQRGINKLKNKAIPSNIRDDISFERNNQHYYYLMRDEIPALVHGLYKRAKWEKKPLSEVFDNFLDWLEDYGVFQETYKRNLLFNQWKRYAIKNLPNVKF